MTACYSLGWSVKNICGRDGMTTLLAQRPFPYLFVAWRNDPTLVNSLKTLAWRSWPMRLWHQYNFTNVTHGTTTYILKSIFILNAFNTNVTVIGDETQHNITILHFYYNIYSRSPARYSPDRKWAANPFYVGINVFNYYNYINSLFISWVPFRATTDGWADWGVVVSTRWWLLVDHCVLRNWDRILVRAVKGLIYRAGMVSICPLLWQRDVKLQQTKPNLPGRLALSVPGYSRMATYKLQGRASAGLY